MAYTTIDKPSKYFNTILYTGTGASNARTGVGFQPDWVWIKGRSGATDHGLYDAVRGVQKQLESNTTTAETTETTGLTAFGTDGFTVGALAQLNTSSATYVAWNWKANETLSKTYAVTVVSSSGNKYRFDGFNQNAVLLELSEGGTFKFDQSDASNIGHPLRFSITSDGTHNSGVEYTTGVTVVGTAGYAGAYTEITVATSAPTLYYYCTVHSGMGGQANTPTTNSFSNLSGSIQSNISPNTTAGFSIVSYTGTGSVGNIGHGLGSTPKMIIKKKRSGADAWNVWHTSIGDGSKALFLNLTNAIDTNANYASNVPTSNLFYVGTDSMINGSGATYIAYCFAEIKGYSKFGSYTGNGSANGTFVYTGFKPAFVITKASSTSGNWKTSWNRFSNGNDYNLMPNSSNAETTGSNQIDLLSNGFKCRASDTDRNGSATTYIYMAFAENPFVTSKGIPTTAR